MQKITKYLCGIIQQAAKITNKTFNIYKKDDFGDLVTDIDKEVETFLIDKLNRKYPEFDVVSEEFNPNHDLTNNCFVIDPIDGTINFASGIPLWGIQIAAIENGEVISSVIYLPKLEELYYADCDGAYLNGTRLEIVADCPNKKPIFSISSNLIPITFQKGSKVSNRNFRSINSASVTYAWVAAGRLNGYCSCANNQWDIMPGMYLVKMAGGLIKDKPGFHIAATNQEMIDFFDELFITSAPAKPAAAKRKTKTTKTK